METVRSDTNNRYATGLAMQTVPHPFEPYPVTPVEPPGHVCNARCACRVCFLEKGHAIHQVHRAAATDETPGKGDP